MRYDSFPLDTQVANDLQSIYVAQKKNNLDANKQRAMLQLFCRHANSKSAPTRMTWQRCCSSNQTRCHLVLWIFIYMNNELFWEACVACIHSLPGTPKVQGYVKTTHSVVLDYAVDVHVLNDEDLQLSYGELGNFRLLLLLFTVYFLLQEFQKFHLTNNISKHK